MFINVLKIITSKNPIGFLLINSIAKRNILAIKKAIRLCKKAIHPETSKKLTKTEILDTQGSLQEMLEDLIINTHKQGWVLSQSLLLAGLYVHDVGCITALESESIGSIASGLTVAWFVITFSAVKKLFLDSATILTFLMFGAFTNAWMVILLSTLFDPAKPLSEKMLISLTISFAWVASAIYDSLDLLRGNMDELAVEFYKKATRESLQVELNQS